MTNLTEPVVYRRTIVDSVQLTGWTPETVQRALSKLEDLCVRQSGEPADDNSQLASELTRWLRCAAQEDPKGLIKYLDYMQPSGEHESLWDKLEGLLASDESLDVSIRLVQERYPDPVPVLCILLDAKVERQSPHFDIDACYQRAVAILLALGTRESLTYLLAHMELLSWNDTALLRRLVQTHGTMFAELAIGAWPSLEWIDRTRLIAIHRECDIDTEPLLALLFAIDTATLDYEALGHFIGALAATDDPRAVPMIHQLIDRALDDIRQQPHDEADRFARAAGRLLIAEMGLGIASDLRARAAKLGIRW